MSCRKGHDYLSPRERQRLGRKPRERHLHPQQNLGEDFLCGFSAVGGCVCIYSLGSVQAAGYTHAEAAESLSMHCPGSLSITLRVKGPITVAGNTKIKRYNTHHVVNSAKPILACSTKNKTTLQRLTPSPGFLEHKTLPQSHAASGFSHGCPSVPFPGPAGAVLPPASPAVRWQSPAVPAARDACTGQPSWGCRAAASADDASKFTQ